MPRDDTSSNKRTRLSPSQLRTLEERLKGSTALAAGEAHDNRFPREGDKLAADKLDDSSPLVSIQPSGTKLPVFCMHPAGGNIICYVPMARLLDPDRPIYGLQSPGLYEDWEPHSRLENLAACYIEAMSSVQPEGPYLLLGWSMGGVVAFEIARQLRALNRAIAVLALLDTWALTDCDESAAEFEQMFLAGFAQELGIVLRARLPWEQIQNLALDDKLDYLAGLAERERLLPEHIGVGEFRRLLRVFLTNIQIMLSYTPHRYSGRVTLLKASEQLSDSDQDRTEGWSDLADEVEAIVVPGNHFSMIRQPRVQVLARRLQSCLDRMNSDCPS